MAAAVTTVAATTAATSTAAVTPATTAATRTARAARATLADPDRLIDAIEVGFARIFGELFAAFDSHGASRRLRHFPLAAAAHFRALLLQNRFAREANAIAFDGQDFHQDLIA